MSLSIYSPPYASYTRQSIPPQFRETEHFLITRVKSIFKPIDVKKAYEAARFYNEARNETLLGLSRVKPLEKIVPEDLPKPLLFRDISPLTPPVAPNVAIQPIEREFSQDRQSFSNKIRETNRRYNIFSFYKAMTKQRSDTLSPSRFDSLSRSEKFLKGAEEGAYYFPSVVLGSMVTAPVINIFNRYSKSRFFDNSSFLSSISLSKYFFRIVILAPICEELLFRSLFQNAVWYGSGSKEASLFFSHLVFAFMHFSPQTLIILFNNPVYSLLYYESDSIWPSMGAHAANNFLGMSCIAGSRIFRK